jgi:phage terminase small subunit
MASPEVWTSSPLWRSLARWRDQVTTKPKRPGTRSLTGKQEAFCIAYIENGGNASGAYRKAYNTSPTCKPNTVEKRACELMTDGKVSGRINELRAKITEKAETKLIVNVETLTNKLEAALQKAMDEGKGASAAVSAVMGIAKLHGLITDKSEARMTVISHEDRLRTLKLEATQTTNGHAHQ